MARMGEAAAPATCGELFQGVLEGEACLVSCPIDWYSRARVTLGSDVVPLSYSWHSDQNIPKTVAALERAVEAGGTVEIDSTLPRSRGYGSSTADIGAALFALARASGRTLDEAWAARLAAEIEPTDSSLLPGLALFAHRGGRRLRALGPAPRLALLVLDPGGEVDTLAYNREVTPARLRRLAGAHQEAFELLQAGLAESDWELFGQGATLSARTHQAVLLNPWLEAALDLCRAVGGVGVCRAHSGTILGVLLDPRRTDPGEALGRARQKLPGEVSVRLHRLVDGGARP